MGTRFLIRLLVKLPAKLAALENLNRLKRYAVQAFFKRSVAIWWYGPKGLPILDQVKNV
jgi:hypothetical protein